MQSLQEKASEWSGVDVSDAFAIDENNLYEKLGLQAFVNLSTDFYNRVYCDEEEWFRSIFANSKMEDAIQNQYEFFVQRMGGPPLFSQRRGHPALIGRHRPFPVTHQAAERWLHHMQQALDGSSEIDSDSKTKMMNFFRHTAFFLVAGDELKGKNQGMACKHATGKPAAAPFDRVHGTQLFNYPGKDPRFNGLNKWILCDCNDDHCLKLLKNCHKVKIVDQIIPTVLNTNSADD